MIRPDCRPTVGCTEDMLGTGKRVALPPSRAIRHSELFPLPVEPANRISRPFAVQSTLLMAHTPDVIAFASPAEVPPRLSGTTNTFELNVLVRRTKTTARPSGDIAA